MPRTAVWAGIPGFAALGLAALCACGPAPRGADAPQARPLPRKVYAHYMGCFCAGTDAIWYHAHRGLETMDFPGEVAREKDPLKRHLVAAINRANNAPSFGGTYRNFALAAGAEWSHPMKLQYENCGWLQIASPGLDWVRADWAAARQWPSTLIGERAEGEPPRTPRTPR